MATVKKAKVDITRKVSVRQFVDSDVFNMGLEQYGLSVFSGESGSGGHKEWLGYKELGDAQIYLTGLDPNADYIRKITDDEKKEAVISQIKEMRAVLEEKYGKESIDPKNKAFWSKIFLEIRTPVLQLDLSNPSNLLLYCGIKAGGFSEVAPSFLEAKESNKIYKYYLHEDEEVMTAKVELTRLRNKAKSALEEIYESDPDFLFLLSKTFLPIERGYSRKTPIDGLYEDINNMIEGAGGDNKNIKAFPKKFLELKQMGKSELRYKALVLEASNNRIIVKDKDNIFVNPSTGNNLGKTEQDIIEYLKNPLHQEDLATISEKVDKLWK